MREEQHGEQHWQDRRRWTRYESALEQGQGAQRGEKSGIDASDDNMNEHKVQEIEEDIEDLRAWCVLRVRGTSARKGAEMSEFI